MDLHKNIYLEKLYDINLNLFMKTLSKNPNIIDENNRQIALKSVINYQATFLDNKCEMCDCKLIDPSGTLLYNNKYISAICANCGFKTKLSNT